MQARISYHWAIKTGRDGAAGPTWRLVAGSHPTGPTGAAKAEHSHETVNRCLEERNPLPVVSTIGDAPTAKFWTLEISTATFDARFRIERQHLLNRYTWF
jgi:hypothetical protein